MARRVLVILAHPVLERSQVNRRLAEAVSGLEGVTVHDLYERYPTLRIDVKHEQRLLDAHQAVVFQHPFYWYSAPSLVKDWQDLVLEYGWAYGRGGDKLRGKVTCNAITTGGPVFAYRKDGYNRFTMRELLAPFDQTAHLCGMKFLAPFVVHASLRIETDEHVRPHAEAYRKLLTALRDETLDVEAAMKVEKVSDELDALIRKAS
ncbi:MAG: NAD(P)H-dependent oxidoreductase [Archangiaceae bacterium]|nr:NAD(P)H-dependent oxidoreductase [Archangiaceae bacterium]